MLTAVVVAHPKRIEWAQELAEQTSATIVLDTEGLGAGGNHRRALEVGLATGADHILSLEDDALPVPNLMAHVADAIEHRPGGDGLIGLYVGKTCPRAERVEAAVQRATESGASWITASGLLWGVATVWPQRLAGAYLKHAHDNKLWDTHVRQWCQRNRHDVAYCWPSLVDHRDAPSTIERATPKVGRVAHGVGVSTWNSSVVAM